MKEKIVKGNNRKKSGLKLIILVCLLTGSLTACTGNVLPGGETETPTIMEPKTESRQIETQKQQEEEATSAEIENQITTSAMIEAQTERPEETASLAEETVQVERNGSGESTASENSGRKAMQEAYVSVLKNILEKQVFPGGQEYGYDGYDLSNNKFAVYDIDSDGRDELIILYTTTFTAGMTEHIYDFDSQSGTVREQFLEYPSNRYYSNGMVESDASHNQGLAGRFWPYTLYRYDKETDSYKVVATVDAWDKSLRETDYNGEPFPDEVDKNGDLLIYYIVPDGVSSVEPVDMEEYEQWQNSLLGGAELLNIPYLSLTEENIQSIR